MSTILEQDLIIDPIERAKTVPSSWYTSPDALAAEYDTVFAKSWHYACALYELPEIGSRVPVTIGKEPIVIVRGKDDVIRAFYNVCRHRGGPIATEAECASVLKCHYHGWTYTLDGQLRGVPDFDRVELFDKKDFGLVPVHAEVWENFVFVCLDTPHISLEEHLRGISERIRNATLRDLKFHKRIVYDVKCNWKAYVDNYLEGYHVPIVHPELMKIYDFNKYITETRDWYSFQHSPLDEGESLYSKRALSPEAREALYFFIYPNLMLNILPGRLQTNLVQPISATECRIIFDYYYDDISSPESLALIEEDMRFSDEVQAEDIDICERVQVGLSSRSYSQGRYSVKRENALYHFHTLLRRAFAGHHRVERA
jgi:choline monooxygenase